MKDREYNILAYLMEHGNVSLKELLTTFTVSKRTLYYDIEAINFYIRGYGQIKNINRHFCYIGNHKRLIAIMNHKHDVYMTSEQRIHAILYNILRRKRRKHS